MGKKKTKQRVPKSTSLRQKTKTMQAHNAEMAEWARILLYHVVETHKRCAELYEAAKGIKVTPLAFRVQREMKDICVVLGPYAKDVIEMGKGGISDASGTETDGNEDSAD